MFIVVVKGTDVKIDSTSNETKQLLLQLMNKKGA